MKVGYIASIESTSCFLDTFVRSHVHSKWSGIEPVLDRVLLHRMASQSILLKPKERISGDPENRTQID